MWTFCPAGAQFRNDATWWEQFKIQNFASLVPTQKWQEEKRNMRIGNIVLLSKGVNGLKEVMGGQ